MNKFTCPSCKYKFVRDWGEGLKEKDYIIEGDKEPIALYFSNSIKVHKSGNTMLYEDDPTVHLYACPHCKTVIVD